jgi:Ca-activated chloride channel homolog
MYNRTGIKTAFFSFKVMLIFFAMYAIVGWDLPFLSQRSRGDNDFEAGRYREAIDHYQNAIERDGGDWQVYYNLGTSSYRAGDYSGAIDQLKTALQLAQHQGVSDYDQGRILHNTGLAYLQMDDCENAVSTLTEAGRLAGPDDDIQANLKFAQDYCAGESQQPPQTEGEQQNQGAGNQDEDQQGSNQGDSNDQSEAQDQADAEQGNQDQGGTDNTQQDQNEDTNNQQGDQQDQNDQQNGQEESQDQAGQQGDQNEAVDQNQGNEDNQDQGENQGQEETAGGDHQSDTEQGTGQNGNADEHSPNEIPNDGLNMSDAQIQEILDWMSNRERMNAPRYFNNQPQSGDPIDEETLAQLIQRLFGNEQTRADEMPSDGIDW